MRIVAFLLCVSATAAAIAGCEQKSQPYKPVEPTAVYRTEKLMGTLVTIQVRKQDMNKDDLEAAIDSAFKRIKEIEKAMSIHLRDSEVSGVNGAAGSHRVCVSDDTYAVVKKALEIAKKTDGAFDITVGPLVEIWKEAGGEAGIGDYPPEQTEIDEALKLVGCCDREKMEIGEENGRKFIHLKKKGMRIDLGGIAKGYAADEAIKVLQSHGIKNAVVEAGGDVRAIGRPDRKEGWPVDARHYAGLARYFDRWILEDKAVATSSDYERGCTLGGRRYSHIINPRTGQALTGLYSVSVFAPDCATADALATAISVAGSEKGEEWMQKTFRKCDFVVVHYTARAEKNFAP